MREVTFSLKRGKGCYSSSNQSNQSLAILPFGLLQLVVRRENNSTKCLCNKVFPLSDGVGGRVFRAGVRSAWEKDTEGKRQYHDWKVVRC